jgi:hypothetical protein
VINQSIVFQQLMPTGEPSGLLRIVTQESDTHLPWIARLALLKAF